MQASLDGRKAKCLFLCGYYAVALNVIDAVVDGEGHINVQTLERHISNTYAH